MHDVILVQLLESLQQLSEYYQRLGLWQLFLSVQHALQRAIVAVLVHKIEVVRSLQGFNKTHDVGMLESGQNVDFVYGELLQLGVGLEG